MKILANTLLLSIAACTLSACGGGDEAEAADATFQETAGSGSATLAIGEESYDLDVTLCHGPETGNYEGKAITSFSIKAADSNIELAILGTKGPVEEDSFYVIKVDGGVRDGGTMYSQKMPFDVFDGKELHFKGGSQAKKLGEKPDAVIPIEISLSC